MTPITTGTDRMAQRRGSSASIIKRCNQSLLDRGLTYDLVSSLVAYDPETGKMFWKERTAGMGIQAQNVSWWNSEFAGKEAFCTDDGKGYLIGSILDRKVQAHRVAWLLVHGEWPSKQIDHINGDRGDNRLSNLREASSAENARNQKMFATNTSGRTGVYWHKNEKKWLASIFVDRKRKHLGQYSRFEDAVAAREAAEIEHGYHPNHGRSERPNVARPGKES